jgi:hypothetical protein
VITIRGDGHDGRPEVRDWCEDNGVAYVFGLTGTKALAAKVEDIADTIRVVRALGDKDAVRGFARSGMPPSPGASNAASLLASRRPAARPRYPLRGHEHRHRHARMALRRTLLRPRPGGEPD